ncbi:MAG: hypothetical protein WCZ02_00970, partial [Lysobacterales bacterium]
LDRELALLQSAFADLDGAAGHRLLAADVTNEDVMTQVLARVGDIDVLVHAAGGFTMGESVA